ncbi:MAG TPA: carbamoyltransferase C-terminal domain-containing protein [Candidatus Nanoarchaeia archaeon]|nr:carbamoyltransferase C-terminal domain-containing protein [Candidatus Nanoarchaeia archaeon]
MTYILGINSAYHESAACLIEDGKIIAAAEEERFTRIKHAKPSRVDNADELPIQAIDFCLKRAGITLTNVDYVGYSLNPEKRLTKNTQHEHQYSITPDDFGTVEGEQLFFQKNKNVEKMMREQGFRGTFRYIDHHDSHAASSFFVSGFDDAAVLVIDGIGEFESTTMYNGRGNRLKKIGSIEFPNSLGFLWEKICKYLGFSEYDACKVMGLASYGNAETYRHVFDRFVQLDNDGHFTIDDTITQFRSHNYSALEALFGISKRTEPVKDVARDTKKYADIAAALQDVTEDIVIRLARSAKEKTSSKNLCLAGGVALNCVANGKLLEERVFDEIFIQPAANDAGTALGAALYVWNQMLNKPRSFVFKSPFLGPAYAETEMQQALDKSGLKYERYGDIEKTTAKLLADGKLVAWFQDAMELGPRALGNRSLLCDPRRKDAVALLNHKVKHREPFRPFCPSVLAEKASEWFDVEGVPSMSEYMLGAFRVLPSRKEIIPAVVHVDGTARIQAVEKETNPKYHALIQEFEKLTGVPVVLNTSFNDSEPIVCSPEDAINTFLKTQIDYLVMGKFLVSRGAP